MPRPIRYQNAGFVHHVISKGNDRQVIFQEAEDYQKYLQLLDIARKEYPLKVYNFLILENQIHLLVEPTQEGSLSKVMEFVSKSYAKYFNKKYEREGHVWQGRFKSFLIQAERYFFACSRYIDLSPVNSKLVNDPKKYEWSGFATLTQGKLSNFKLDEHRLYLNLGSNAKERQMVYKAMILNYQGEELDLMEMRAGILGDKEFKEQIRNQK